MESSHQASNSVLLSNLNTYINEDEITKSIFESKNTIDKIETFSGPSTRTQLLRKDLVKLENLLAYSKDQSNIRSQNFSQINSISKGQS